MMLPDVVRAYILPEENQSICDARESSVAVGPKRGWVCYTVRGRESHLSVGQAEVPVLPSPRSSS